ncbi:hypothetical protein ID866_2349 [Astraeus odoratus]|nr:hypothetical protein ID866_2349 [Astraeus odoratus]
MGGQCSTNPLLCLDPLRGRKRRQDVYYETDQFCWHGHTVVGGHLRMKRAVEDTISMAAVIMEAFGFSCGPNRKKEYIEIRTVHAPTLAVNPATKPSFWTASWGLIWERLRLVLAMSTG